MNTYSSNQITKALVFDKEKDMFIIQDSKQYTEVGLKANGTSYSQSMLAYNGMNFYENQQQH